MMKKGNRGQINQVFIYAVSLIVVAFVAWLAFKFIFGFTGAAEDRQDIILYNQLETDYKSVFTEYGSQKEFTYKTTPEVKFVCFAQDGVTNPADSCEGLDENLGVEFAAVIDADDNVAVFGAERILHSDNMGDFKVDNDKGCICFEPKNNRFSVLFENRRNVVWIMEN
ncbi:MAG: hypothetical protein ACOCXG_02415 [Nanoarchaeota archaeon]